MLDVKVGCGAFLEDRGRVPELAATMVELGRSQGRHPAVLTDMNTPLGADRRQRARGRRVPRGAGWRRSRRRGRTDRPAGRRAAGTRRDRRPRSGPDPAGRNRDGPFCRLVAAQAATLDAPLPIGAHSETVSAPKRHNGDIDAMAGGADGVAARRGPGTPRRAVSSPGAGVASTASPASRWWPGSRCSPLHRHPGARVPPRWPNSTAGGALRRRAPGPSPDHRSDRLDDHPADPEMISRAPKALLHDHLDGGLRPATVLDIAGQVGYDGLPTTDDGVGGLVPYRRPQRVPGALLEPFAHTVAVMQTPTPCTGWRRNACRPGRRQRGLR